jgi:hypothetical protein
MKWLRELFRRRPTGTALPQAQLTFTSTLGKKLDVCGIVCATCKNYFFVTRVEIEQPKFCPYCGTDFSKSIEFVPGESIEDQLV